jgi:hypothetical protein
MPSAHGVERQMIVLSSDSFFSLPTQIPTTPEKGWWECESFIFDNTNTGWSCVCSYNTETGKRNPIAMIQEFFVKLSDDILDSAIQFEDLPLPREKLSRSILDWFGNECITNGMSKGVEVDKESKAFLRLPETSMESSPWPPEDMIKNLSDGM